MRPGFMSSVFPKQTLEELISTAQTHGYEGIEFRLAWEHQHGIELDASETQVRDARRMLSDGGITASCIATSVRFNALDVADHLPQRKALRKAIVLAAQLGAPVIRTFSDGLPEDATEHRQVLHLAAESYAAVDPWAKQHGIVVLVETHTNMKGQWAKQILDEAGATNLAVLWHTAHHLQRGQSVDEAYDCIQGHVRHVHFTAESDSEVVTDADNQRMFDLLARDGFEGFFSVELINPEDPDAVLAHHIKKFHEYLGR